LPYFKVIVIFQDTDPEVSEHDIELSSVNNNSTDFLTDEELSYYFGLEEL